MGAIPAAIVVLCSILEAKWYPAPDAPQQGLQRSQSVKDTKDLFTKMIRTRETQLNLLVTGGGWFIYDVAYYGVSLFGGQIVGAVYETDDDNVTSKESLRHVTGMELLALAMSVPAILASIYALKHVSIKNLQVWGFVFIVVCFALLGGLFDMLKSSGNSDALYAIYCLLLFSLSFGPNLSTFILPAQTYPKKVRATFNGISAACGKLGAFAGIYLFGPIGEATSYPVVMIICAVVSAIGAIVTQFCLHSLDSEGHIKDNDDVNFAKNSAQHTRSLLSEDEDDEEPVLIRPGSFG